MVANTMKLPEGYIGNHYDDNSRDSSPCETVVLMSIGTAMSTESYELLSSELVTNTSTVFITMDPNPFHLVKLNTIKYIRLATAIINDITTLVPICTKPPIHGYIVGGHSAGGQAAMQALPALLESRIIIPNTIIVAFLGLDPFNAKSAHVNISIPAMYWGFTKTTCLVTAQYAAQYAYQHSTSKKRVFYQVANTHTTDIITHCIFTDHGCNLCPSNENNDAEKWVRIAIGKSVNQFIAAIASNGEFPDDDFLLKEYNDVNVYVDGRTIQRAVPSFEEVHYENVSAIA